MIVVHIESGFGNQMLSYCEYLALKKTHPKDDIYIETITFDIPEVNDYICQWNGYELDRVFGVNSPNVKVLFSKDQWDNIMEEVKKSQFWKKNWNYPVYITKAFNYLGLNIKNIRGDFENNGTVNILTTDKKTLSYYIKQTGFYCNLRRIYQSVKPNKFMKTDTQMLFYKGTDNVFTGQRLSFKYRGNDIERIDEQIRETFQFPQYDDDKNIELSDKIKRCESVAIHARRGDMLSCNGKYYKSGYFKRAVTFIKKNVNNPEFYFFCDPGSIDWCKENEKIFGLNFSKDKVYFIDWNKGDRSFRDMQLMTECKHNIITNSSFGWWGAYLNKNPNKITISPEININTTHHF